MKMNSREKLRNFAELKHGSIFVASISGSSHLCVKGILKVSEDQPGSDWVVVLSPGLADYGGEPGLIDSSLVQNAVVLEMEGVKLVPSSDPSDIQFDSGYSPSAGSVFVFSTGTYLSVKTNSDHLLLNVESGELVVRPPELKHAKIGSWRLVRPVNRDIEELATHPSS